MLDNLALLIGIAVGAIGTLAVEAVLLLIVWLAVRGREDEDDF